MRVALLSKAGGASGGAGRMASNLREWLAAEGVDARLFTAHPSEGARAYPPWIHKLKAIEVRTLMNEVLPLEHPALMRTLHRFDPDVVHVHDISRAFSIDTIGKMANHYPTVWTMHDQSPITGGCISPHPCTRYEVGCGSCPKFGSWALQGRVDLTSRTLERKRMFFEARVAQLATPSQWAADRFASSRVVPHDVEINVVPNAIDTTWFRAIPKAEARRWLGLPPDRFIITLIAHDLSDLTKNPESQREALRLIADLKPYLLLVGNTQGNPSATYAPNDLRVMGFVTDESLKNAIFAASDIFLNTSLSDTFSLTTLEALASGTPVVAYASGGIPEILVHGECGVLVAPDDPELLAEAISDLISEGIPGEWHAAAQTRAAQFNPKAHTTGYLDVYRAATGAAG